jgi:hypothetical protein
MIETFAAFLFMDDHLFGFVTKILKKIPVHNVMWTWQIWQNRAIAK